MHVIFLFFMLVVGVKAYNETVPEWVDLECEVCRIYIEVLELVISKIVIFLFHCSRLVTNTFSLMLLTTGMRQEQSVYCMGVGWCKSTT